jgi:hypothetical protein
MPYKEANPEADAQEMNKTRGGVPFFTPKGEKGKYVTSYVRILPPRDDHPTESFFYWACVHGNLPGAGRPVLCPSRMFDRPCPACQEARSLDQRGMKDEARDFWPSWRALVNVCVVDENGNIDPDKEGVFVWAIPKTLMEDLEAKIKEIKDEKKRRISSPASGRDVIVKRKGTGPKDTKYEVALAEPSQVGQDIMDLLEDGLFFLPDIYPELPTARIAGLLSPAQANYDPEPEYVEGTYRELPAPTSNRRRPPVDDDDDVPFDRNGPNDEDEAPSGANVDVARARLEASLGRSMSQD